jgi:hypothetical protein
MIVHEHSYERYGGSVVDYAIIKFDKHSNHCAPVRSYVVIHQAGYMVRVSKWHEVDL